MGSRDTVIDPVESDADDQPSERRTRVARKGPGVPIDIGEVDQEPARTKPRTERRGG